MNRLAEARVRLLAGWKQSVPGGWPDIPPAGVDLERVRLAAADTAIVHGMRAAPIHPPRPPISRLELIMPLVILIVAVVGVAAAVWMTAGGVK